MASTRAWNIQLGTAISNTSTPLPTRTEDKVSDDAIRVVEKIIITGLGGAAAGHYLIEFRSASGADFHVTANVESPSGLAFYQAIDLGDGLAIIDMISHGTNRQYTPNSGSLPGTDERIHASVTGTAAASGMIHVLYKWVRPSPLRD